MRIKIVWIKVLRRAGRWWVADDSHASDTDDHCKQLLSKCNGGDMCNSRSTQTRAITPLKLLFWQQTGCFEPLEHENEHNVGDE